MIIDWAEKLMSGAMTATLAEQTDQDISLNLFETFVLIILQSLCLNKLEGSVRDYFQRKGTDR
jgi:hypothetical protein